MRMAKREMAASAQQQSVSCGEQRRTTEEAATAFAHHKRAIREQMHVAEEAVAVAQNTVPETLCVVQQRTREAAVSVQVVQVRMAQAH